MQPTFHLPTCRIQEALRYNSTRVKYWFEPSNRPIDYDMCDYVNFDHFLSQNEKNMADFERNRTTVMAALFDVFDNGGVRDVTVQRRSGTTTAIVDWIVSRMALCDKALDLHVVVGDLHAHRYLKSAIAKKVFDTGHLFLESLVESKIGVTHNRPCEDSVVHHVEVHVQAANRIPVKEGSVVICDAVSTTMLFPDDCKAGVVTLRRGPAQHCSSSAATPA